MAQVDTTSTNKNVMNDWTSATVTENGKTDKGTKIVSKSSNTLGEDAFVKILMAELQNQDPTANQDSTQYIAQLAQFSSVQEMTNLNKTMTFFGASSAMGKFVTLNQVDDRGNAYQGVVQKVEKNGDSIKVYVELIDPSTGKYEYQEKVDANGNPIKDKDGNIEYLTYTDTETDATGKTVNVQKYVPKVKEFDYSNVTGISNIPANVVDTTIAQQESKTSKSTSSTSDSTSTTGSSTSSTT